MTQPIAQESAEPVREEEIRGPAGTWTERVYGAFPLAPAWVGVAFASLLIAAFVGSEIALGRHEILRGAENPMVMLSDARIAIVHCLLVAFLPTAYVYLLRGSQQAPAQLRPVLACSDREFAELTRAVGTYTSGGPFFSGLVGVAFLAWINFETTPEAYRFAWQQWSPEAWWHRALGLPMGWWIGRFTYATLAESNRLSRLARRLTSIDLLDLRPLAPFTRRSLANALLVVGLASIASLLLLESGFVGPVLESRFVGLTVGIWVFTAAVSAGCVVLPVRGVHHRIRSAKQAELDWCRDALRRARAALTGGRGDPDRGRMDELVAYLKLVEGVREWPFDISTVLRFSLYLMIPIGSWLGGAMVERLVNSFLD
jgi:hypothetical protein